MIAAVVVAWLLSACLCAYIANGKGLDVGRWALGGLFFGIFTVIFIALEPARSMVDEDDEPRPVTPLEYLSNPSLWDVRTWRRKSSR